MTKKIDYKEMSAAEYLSERGRIGGSVKSDKKAVSSAANGRKNKGKKHAEA